MSLTACASEQPIDFNRAQLMPELAAKKIIASIIPQYDGGAMLQAGPRSFPPVPVQSITMVWFNDRDIEFMVGSIALARDVGVVCRGTLEQARLLAEALTALGASIELYRAPASGTARWC